MPYFRDDVHYDQIQTPTGGRKTKWQQKPTNPVRGTKSCEKGGLFDMYVCMGCDHLLVFHRPRGGNDPCYLCPPCECLVEGCDCAEYRGTQVTDRPHKDHLEMKVLFGSWGLIDFSSEESCTFVGGPEPVIERAGVRLRSRR